MIAAYSLNWKKLGKKKQGKEKRIFICFLRKGRRRAMHFQPGGFDTLSDRRSQ
jgi:hypothetical protein